MMQQETNKPPLPTLLECFTNKPIRRIILIVIVSSCFTSFFVTFILSEGMLNPLGFFNNFFKFLLGYLWAIPGLGIVWGVVLLFIAIYFRGYLSPRIFLITNKALRGFAISVSGFTLAFCGLMVLYYGCRWIFNMAMWSRDWNLSVALVAGLFGMVFAFLFFADYENKFLLRQAEHRERELSRHRLEGELMNLNLRIRPHFFFNALNTLASLIDKDTEKAQEFLADLADLFRKSFAHGQDHPVCFWHEEKAILQAYLAVEKMRFQDRLEWHLDVDAPDCAPFPAFLLQPLVENAVHHGISPSHQAASMSIQGSYHEGAWCIRISNSIQEPVQVEIKKGHALWTIQERLKLMEGTLVLESNNDEFRAKLEWREK